MIEQVRRKSPLIHCMTNFVTMDWVARGLLAAGARPVMARDRSEAATVAAGAGALVLNLGTWSNDAQAAMLEAGRAANAYGIPVVLDPVGAGGLATRTDAALSLLEKVQVAAIRANAGEILALAGIEGQVSGVDANVSQGAAVAHAARRVARRFRCVVAATGAVDLVTDGARTLEVIAGHRLMAQIPGSGCLSTALVAACLACGPGGVETVANALLWSGLAGEAAAIEAKGPGSFAAHYLDHLSTLVDLPTDRVRRSLDERLALYVIASGTTPLSVLKDVLAGGAGAIQFREKKLPLPKMVDIGAQMQLLCREAGALFLVNDRVDLALALGADGVHLGQDDLPVAHARRLLGARAIIGATCETPAEAMIAVDAGADYIGTGPVYATSSKADAGEPYGPEVVGRIRSAVALPVVGIGGIGHGTAAPVIRAGACGVAVISAVLGAPDPGAAARTIHLEVLTAKGEA